MLPAGDTPTVKGNTRANLKVCTHAPKTHKNTKQQGGIPIHVFSFEYVYRLCMYVSGLWELLFVWACITTCSGAAMRGPHSVTPSRRVCTSGRCHWMLAHKYVLCLFTCIALLCVYMICIRNMG